MNSLNYVHFTDNYLINPTNPVTVNLIGAGGNGSQMLTALARTNHALLALGHPGLFVTVYDDDTISEANLGRQLFAASEVGQYKALALISRINRFFGTNWKAVSGRFDNDTLEDTGSEGKANLYISCVDNAKSRFDIAAILTPFKNYRSYERNRPLYWMDLGNGRNGGQVLLSTIGNIKQPASQRFAPVSDLRFVTEVYADQLATADLTDDTPSCSLAEALTKQDLFINSALTSMAASLLWQLFREGMLHHRGFFMSLSDFRTQPLKITQNVSE